MPRSRDSLKRKPKSGVRCHGPGLKGMIGFGVFGIVKTVPRVRVVALGKGLSPKQKHLPVCNRKACMIIPVWRPYRGDLRMVKVLDRSHLLLF